eukprot:GHRR01009959.1.p1 GENE.GHRR01009959.1~~GHRR01009959.1.p1  ORF type:complete len:292 (+),score=110.59 GHRR01009959.1:1312-2187(+)
MRANKFLSKNISLERLLTEFRQDPEDTCAYDDGAEDVACHDELAQYNDHTMTQADITNSPASYTQSQDYSDDVNGMKGTDTLAYCQEDPHDDLQHLLHGLSGGEELPETTDLIWGSTDELTVTARAGSSSCDSALQSESPMVTKGVKRSLHSEDDSDSAHSLKRICNDSASIQPPPLVVNMPPSMQIGISPRLVGLENDLLLAYGSGSSVGPSVVDPHMGMWQGGLPEVGEHLAGMYSLCSPTGQQWQMADLLREPDTPSMTMLHALPEHQRECLMEAARMFMTNMQPVDC